MRALITCILILIALTACRNNGTLYAYGGDDRVWTLKLLDGTTFPTKATLTFLKTGEIAGEGPCNRYFGAMKAQYPWFDAGPIGSTRMACPDMAPEAAFLTALEAATFSEALGDTLILSNTDGLEMVFRATE
jgi:heat shock protein HslJ